MVNGDHVYQSYVSYTVMYEYNKCAYQTNMIENLKVHISGIMKRLLLKEWMVERSTNTPFCEHQTWKYMSRDAIPIK